MNDMIVRKKDKYHSRIINKDKRLKVPNRELCFFVTEDCNLDCSYCYLPGKNNKRRMSFDVAKKAIDYFVTNEQIFSEQILTLDFIGGEPLLEIDLIDQILDYFKVLTYKRKHHWFSNYRIMMTSNGTLCKTRKFERLLKKNLDKIFVAISLDGTKDKHDSSRKYKASGKGSYNDVIEGFNFLKEITSRINVKATFSSSDLKYLKDSVLHLYSIMKDIEIFANVVYEDVWQEGDDKIFESQLVELADYIIDNELYNDIEVSFFPEYESIGRPYSKDQLEGHWCNSGHQVTVGPDGTFYPCNRFHEISLFKQKSRSIGNVDDGIDFDKLRPFRVLNLNNCSDLECIECDIATGCGMCSGLSYDESEVGTIFNRANYICLMHKTRARVNKYYWERLTKEKNYIKEKVNFYISQLKNPRKVLNVLISSDSTRICGYKNSNSKTEIIDMDVLKENIRMCRDRNYFVNLVYPSDPLDEKYSDLLNNIDAQRTIPYTNQKDKYQLEDGLVFVLTTGQQLHSNFSCINVILLASFQNLSQLSEYVDMLFKHNILRVNLVFDLSEISIDFDFDIYKSQLNKIANILFDYFKSNQVRYFNVLTDIHNLESMNNCNAGATHVTLGPDGKIYICPAFYYSSMPIESTGFKLTDKMGKILNFKSAFVCKACDSLHCRRCVFDNYIKTGEYNIPGEVQCLISHIEREVSMNLQNRLIKELRINSFKNILLEKDYIDPFEEVKVW